ncbi:MAG: hypothetical protein M1337_08865, partial [Actinobacteria bacterium]|nr:hypothetical protein [Actinomycetota bacterium]
RVMQAHARRRRERDAAERPRSSHGVDVAMALEERDAAVQRHEEAAGRALATLTRDEGVNVADVSDWVPEVSTAEVKRLRRLAETRVAGEGDAPSTADHGGGSVGAT